MSSLARQYQQQQQPIQPQEQQKRKRQVQKKQSSITKGEKGLVLLLVLAAALVGAIMIANYASLYSYNRDIHNLERTIQQQTQVNEGLQLQVIELSAPDRILHIATEKLGMTLDDNSVKVIQN